MEQNKPLRILVISDPPWADENNTGNTLSNLFRHVHAEFANLYFQPGNPHNDLCFYYYQVTDYQIIQRWLKGKAVGRSFTMEAVRQKKNAEKDVSFDAKARRYRGFYATLLREAAWKMTPADTDSMYRFIEAFHPDLIYAPIYGNLRMLRIVSNVQVHTRLPMVSLISDDHYFHAQKENSLLGAWYHRAIQRRLRKLLGQVDCLYTMTQEQAEAYRFLYGKPLKILRKNATVPYVRRQKQVPLKILYAGGTYLGRQKTLDALAEAMQELNRKETRFQLHVYTNSSDQKAGARKRYDNVFVHPGISYRRLMEKYKECDIALHVEGFDASSFSAARLSFSTKILDCLQSGAPVLCIAPKGNAGADYLQREKAAVVVNSPAQIQNALNEIDAQYVKWQKAACDCLERNHDIQKNTAAFERELRRLAMR